jgi:hypothetical protein
MNDIDTAVVDCLKALDPDRPTREADAVKAIANGEALDRDILLRRAASRRRPKLRFMRALFCERRSVLEHQSLLLTPRPLGRGDEILDRERAWPTVGDEPLQNNR